MALTSDITTEIPSQTGNSGKYLTTNGSASSWGTVAGGGMTLLDTLNTTSGTSHVTSTLDLSTYKFLFLSIYNVGSSSSPSLDLQWKETGGTYVKILNYTVVGASVYGSVNHDLGNGVSNCFDSANIPADSTLHIAEGGAAPGVNTAIDTATTSITFRWSADNTFNRGVITIYGLK
jgi:hypothetical protein